MLLHSLLHSIRGGRERNQAFSVTDKSHDPGGDSDNLACPVADDRSKQLTLAK